MQEVNLIDSCIFNAKYLEELDAPYCSNFLADCDRGLVPILAIGEIYTAVIKKVKDPNRRHEILHRILPADLSPFQLVPIEDNVIETYQQLKSLRMESTHDKLLVACAISTDKCMGFVTTDRQVVEEAAAIARIAKQIRGYKLNVWTPATIMSGKYTRFSSMRNTF